MYLVESSGDRLLIIKIFSCQKKLSETKHNLILFYSYYIYKCKHAIISIFMFSFQAWDI